MKKKGLSLASGGDNDQPVNTAFNSLSLSKPGQGARVKRKDFFAGVADMNESGGLPFGEDSEKRMQDLLDEVNARPQGDVSSLPGRRRHGSKPAGSSSQLDIDKLFSEPHDRRAGNDGDFNFKNDAGRQDLSLEGQLIPGGKRKEKQDGTATALVPLLDPDIDVDRLNRLEQEFSKKFGEQFATELSHKPLVDEEPDDAKGRDKQLELAILGIQEEDEGLQEKDQLEKSLRLNELDFGELLEGEIGEKDGDGLEALGALMEGSKHDLLDEGMAQSASLNGSNMLKKANLDDEGGLGDFLADFGDLRLTKKDLQGIGKLAELGPSESKAGDETDEGIQRQAEKPEEIEENKDLDQRGPDEAAPQLTQQSSSSAKPSKLPLSPTPKKSDSFPDGLRPSSQPSSALTKGRRKSEKAKRPPQVPGNLSKPTSPQAVTPSKQLKDSSQDISFDANDFNIDDFRVDDGMADNSQIQIDQMEKNEHRMSHDIDKDAALDKAFEAEIAIDEAMMMMDGVSEKEDLNQASVDAENFAQTSSSGKSERKQEGEHEMPGNEIIQKKTPTSKRQENPLQKQHAYGPKMPAAEMAQKKNNRVKFQDEAHQEVKVNGPSTPPILQKEGQNRNSPESFQINKLSEQKQQQNVENLKEKYRTTASTQAKTAQPAASGFSQDTVLYQPARRGPRNPQNFIERHKEAQARMTHQQEALDESKLVNIKKRAHQLKQQKLEQHGQPSDVHHATQRQENATAEFMRPEHQIGHGVEVVYHQQPAPSSTQRASNQRPWGRKSSAKRKYPHKGEQVRSKSRGKSNGGTNTTRAADEQAGMTYIQQIFRQEAPKKNLTWLADKDRPIERVKPRKERPSSKPRAGSRSSAAGRQAAAQPHWQMENYQTSKQSYQTVCNDLDTLAEEEKRRYVEGLRKKSRERHQSILGANKQIGVLETKEQKLEHDLNKLDEQYDRMKMKLHRNPNAMDPERATLDRLARLKRQAEQQKPRVNPGQINVKKSTSSGLHVTFARSTKQSATTNSQNMSFIDQSSKSRQEASQLNELTELTVANIPRNSEDSAAQAYDLLKAAKQQNKSLNSKKSPTSIRSYSRKSSGERARHLNHKSQPTANITVQKQSDLASQILIIDQSDQKRQEIATTQQKEHYETIELEQQREYWVQSAERGEFEGDSRQLRSFEAGSYRFEPITYAGLRRKQRAYEVQSGHDQQEGHAKKAFMPYARSRERSQSVGRGHRRHSHAQEDQDFVSADSRNRQSRRRSGARSESKEARAAPKLKIFIQNQTLQYVSLAPKRDSDKQSEENVHHQPKRPSGGIESGGDSVEPPPRDDSQDQHYNLQELADKKFIDSERGRSGERGRARQCLGMPTRLQRLSHDGRSSRSFKSGAAQKVPDARQSTKSYKEGMGPVHTALEDGGSMRSSSQERMNDKFRVSVERVDESSQSQANHNQILLDKIKNKLFAANHIMAKPARGQPTDQAGRSTTSYQRARAAPASQNVSISIDAAQGPNKSLSYYKALREKRQLGEPSSTIVHTSDPSALFDCSLAMATLASPLPAEIHPKQANGDSSLLRNILQKDSMEQKIQNKLIEANKLRFEMQTEKASSAAAKATSPQDQSKATMKEAEETKKMKSEENKEIKAATAPQQKKKGKMAGKIVRQNSSRGKPSETTKAAATEGKSREMRSRMKLDLKKLDAMKEQNEEVIQVPQQVAQPPQNQTIAQGQQFDSLPRATRSSRAAAGRIVKQRPPVPISKNTLDHPNNSTAFLSEASHYSSIIKDLKGLNKNPKQSSAQESIEKKRSNLQTITKDGGLSSSKAAGKTSTIFESTAQKASQEKQAKFTLEKKYRSAVPGQIAFNQRQAEQTPVKSSPVSSPRYHMTTPKTKKKSKSPVATSSSKHKKSSMIASQDEPGKNDYSTQLQYYKSMKECSQKIAKNYQDLIGSYRFPTAGGQRAQSKKQRSNQDVAIQPAEAHDIAGRRPDAMELPIQMSKVNEERVWQNRR